MRTLIYLKKWEKPKTELRVSKAHRFLQKSSSIESRRYEGGAEQ
jgi:hypothetical protein